MRLPVAEGRAHAQPLPPARAPAQAGHLGVDVGLIEKDQAVRLLAHARLTLGMPDPALIPHVGACALRRNEAFFYMRSHAGTESARALREQPRSRVRPAALRRARAW